MAKGYLIEKINLDKINICKKIKVESWSRGTYYEEKENDFFINKDNEFKNMNLVSWIKSTIGNPKTGENIINENIRDSFCSDEKFIVKGLDYEELNIVQDILGFDFESNIDINYNNEGNYLRWNLVKYEQNGMFKKHSDGKKNEMHFSTALLIPPYSINKFKGGELLLYTKEGEIIEILPDETDWKLVIFGLDVEHELKEVIEGIRYVFKIELELTWELKLLMESKQYNNKVEDIKLDDKELENEKNNLQEEIEELEKKLEIKKNMYNNLLERKIGDIDISEFLNEIEKYLRKNNENNFMVALLNNYQYPVPDNFKIKDIIIYNGLLEKFKNDNIKINIMNIKTKLNMGDGSCGANYWNADKLSLSCWIEDYKPKNEIDQVHKFDNVNKFYAKDFYDDITPGDCFHSSSQYNDSTYDYIELLDITYLYISINNNYYDKN
jgi:hypothetical protein